MCIRDSDKIIRGGVKIQKRDLETKDTKAQGSATLQYTEFNIISLNDSPAVSYTHLTFTEGVSTLFA